MNMRLESSFSGGNLELRVIGELDHHTAREAMRGLMEKIDKYLPNTCIVDFSGLQFMDSSGIAFALNAQRRMREIGGTMYLQGVGGQAMRVIRASGVDRIMNIKEAVE